MLNKGVGRDPAPLMWAESSRDGNSSLSMLFGVIKNFVD